MRFKIWQPGYELTKKPTLIGLGDSHIEAKQQLANEGRTPQESVHWKHYHNQYINSFVKTGIIGFTFILILLIAPVIYCFKSNKDNRFQILAILIPIVYAVSSLTDIPLSQSITLGFYVITIFILTTKLSDS